MGFYLNKIVIYKCQIAIIAVLQLRSAADQDEH